MPYVRRHQPGRHEGLGEPHDQRPGQHWPSLMAPVVPALASIRQVGRPGAPSETAVTSQPAPPSRTPSGPVPAFATVLFRRLTRVPGRASVLVALPCITKCCGTWPGTPSATSTNSEAATSAKPHARLGEQASQGSGDFADRLTAPKSSSARKARACGGRTSAGYGSRRARRQAHLTCTFTIFAIRAALSRFGRPSGPRGTVAIGAVTWGFGWRANDKTLLIRGYGTFARGWSRLKRADLPAFWVLWAVRRVRWRRLRAR